MPSVRICENEATSCSTVFLSLRINSEISRDPESSGFDGTHVSHFYSTPGDTVG